MKKFVYQVMSFEFTDTEPFGKAWREAKEKAAELHAPVFRLVIKGGNVRQEVYYEGGAFNNVKFMDVCKVKIF